ncbi:phosphoadenosine phosphosulfate reductase family protein [Burkholderia sp. BCCIQ04A]|uniref:Phosphoadenosine phosphosulfate reductase family protein n=1 Tax=Burkholderia anthinoferrum TaxID=3090833 RepID=A0ABU5WL17_9BURK|nr:MULTISPECIES: phosphoadenosine phosphosulfate reductase family protein [Burkholderia]MEB2503656.1 phosphoadenosine phosphosulfate reductase family protein [Burkholderia anthinoferrum]MEB2535094.1 phosphoadenosine phosphosulfate reductase family protein [Burkholderia anthinoferrum]MEB2560874.1 phosphoadenosine phosphosulfate reductase family protein [Burkholderia anthinoferrum]MEB2579420.1 phosphoadenosine phosphosulfate reductase family protein [Burkholderia anthinoferrum]MEB2635364.1 phosp
MSDHVFDPALSQTAQREIAEAMSTHQRPVLKFSGGKDSLACLYLLRPWWNRVTVLWANSGDPYPETVEQMRRIRELVSNFVEVPGPGYIRGHAVEQTFPADMVPWTATAIGRLCSPNAPSFKLHSTLECCAANVWAPMQNKIRELGADLVIRGEREAEAHRPPITNGVVDPQNGGTQLIPLRRWSKDDVFSYLRAQGVELPRQYAYGMGSLDCLHCTAHLAEAGGKLRYLRDFHPDVAVEYERRLRLIQSEQERHTRLVKVALGEVEPVGAEGLGD